MHARRVLVLGATSAIAQAYARKCAERGAAFMLVGRHDERLRAIAADLLASGAAGAEHFVTDLAAVADIEKSVHELWTRFPDPDEALIAYGDLGDQAIAEQNLAAARALLDNNFTSAALWILGLLKERRPEAPLTVVAIGSVAGDRGRATNFLYGAAKGGLDRFLEGLAQKSEGTPVRIITVKPGFVDTPMTAAIDKRGPLWATPDQVAEDIYRGVTQGKRLVYTPWYWWLIMTVIRHLPWFVFKRLKV